jgi:hypothetical protein
LVTTVKDQNYIIYEEIKRSRGSSIGIATGYWLVVQGIGVQFPAVERDFPLLHNVQIGSGAHPASYLMVSGLVPPRI